MYKMFLMVLIIVSISCAGLSEKKSYVIIVYNGGVITDVYKVRDYEDARIVSFKDVNGNKVIVIGSYKIIRVTNSLAADKYHEYHAEFETKSYQELYIN